MFRFRSALKFAAPLAVLLATTAVSLTSTSVRAEWDEIGQNEDGSATLYYNDDTGHWAVVIEKDGKYGVYIDDAVAKAMLEKLGIGGSNPNPDDPTDGKGTSKPDVKALEKLLKDAAAVVHNTPLGSKLGGVIEQGGGGKAPHWNPGDGDDKGPGDLPSSKDHKGGLTAEQKATLQKQLNYVAKQATLGEQGMFDGSEGGTENAPSFTVHSKKNDPSDSQGDPDNGNHEPDKPANVPKGEDLGPKPELVNPNPEMKTGVTGGKGKSHGTVVVKKVAVDKTNGKTDGKTAQRSNVMSQGLLDGSNGFSPNGPSGMGHSTRLR